MQALNSQCYHGWVDPTSAKQPLGWACDGHSLGFGCDDCNDRKSVTGERHSKISKRDPAFAQAALTEPASKLLGVTMRPKETIIEWASMPSFSPT